MNAVHVRRLTVNCTVARDHPSSERVRWRMEEIARGPLKDALESVLAPLERAQGDEVIVLRKLEMSFDLDVSQSVDVLARRWAAQVADAMVGTLQDGSGVSGVARFADETAFLARYLVDRADGQAEGKWYYRAYAGLSALAVSAALRTAILDGPHRGVAALGSVSRDELERILVALGEREARRIVESWGGDDALDVDFTQAAESILEKADVWRPRIASCASAWTLAMTMVVSGREKHASLENKAITKIAAAMAGWVFRARATKRDSSRRSIDEASLPDPTSLLRIDPMVRQRIEAALELRPQPDAASPESTPFGGLLLLLRHIAELPIETTWCDGGDRAHARLAILSRCAGASRARRVREDALIRRLVDVREEPSEAASEEWFANHGETLERVFLPALVAFRHDIARLPPPHTIDSPTAESILDCAARTVLSVFARRLPGFSESSPEFLYENFLSFRATVEEVGGKRICRVGRPPLASVLIMTGALRGALEIPWLDRSRLELKADG